MTVKKGQEQDQTAKDKDENFTSVLKESTRKTRTNVAAVHSLNVRMYMIHGSVPCMSTEVPYIH